jgi:hypothetical protein
MSDYLLGLATLPAVALVLWLLLVTLRAIRDSWSRWRPTFIGDEDRRAHHAASLAVARRVLVVHLPGGRIVAWRSLVPGARFIVGPEGQAYAHVRDALDEAGRDPVVLEGQE